MSKYLIAVEGKADAVFLYEYLHFIFTNDPPFIKSTKPAKISVGSIINVFDTPTVKILITGGCTNIKNYKTPLMMHKDEGFTITFVQDADDPSKDYGGFENRMHYLKTQEKEIEVNFDIFLFPNQKDNGDLETLLLSLVAEDKYNSFFRYYNDYIEGTSALSEGKFSDELLENKLRIYNYCQVFCGMDKAREENREYNNNCWNLSHDSLAPLLLFLKGIIN